jgi:hypothetical protein
MASKKDSVIFYQRQIDICKANLTPEQFGRLMYALFAFSEGEDPEVDDDIALAFGFMSLQQQIDREKYDKIVERNRKNGAKGGRPKKNPENPNGFFENPNDNVNDNDNDNENVNVNEASDDTDLYGTLKNVELAPGEYEHLKSTYERHKELIDKVSVWLPNAKGNHQSDHFALCLKFANNDDWPKKKKIEPTPLPEVVDPLDDEEREAKVLEMKAKLNGMFSSS